MFYASSNIPFRNLSCFHYVNNIPLCCFQVDYFWFVLENMFGDHVEGCNTTGFFSLCFQIATKLHSFPISGLSMERTPKIGICGFCSKTAQFRKYKCSIFKSFGSGPSWQLGSGRRWCQVKMQLGPEANLYRVNSFRNSMYFRSY